ncbi:MAG: DUF2336 domain-containing protein, partial [Rubrivivax sp.]|nr:DUF2336 domain-containing protein [Rubrivivax sp.]
ARLAAERSADKRVELLRRVSSVYAARADLAPTAERYLFNDVVSTLIGKISGADRASASGALAAMPQLPETLVRNLASDADIAVAGPMIRDYKAMPEAMLVEVAQSGSQDHLRMIAARNDVTPPVSDVVAERGDISVVRILAGNGGARFSDAGMRRMIAKAEHDPQLQALLVERKDLSFAAVEYLLPMISDELASRLGGKAGAVNDATVVTHLAQWLEDRKRNVERTHAYIVGLRNGDLNAGDVFRDLFGAGRLFDAATVLASVLTIDGGYAFGVLAGQSLQSALLLLRAAGLPWPVAELFLKLRKAKAAHYEFGSMPTRAEYLVLDAGAAQRVVRFARVRQTAAAPVSPGGAAAS